MESAEATALRDLKYQQQMLPRVSRTFALTIPQLPAPLDQRVANAYLLCRIADSVEDDPGLDRNMKRALHGMLPEAIESRGTAEAFARAAGSMLTDATSPAERELVVNTPRVARLTREYPKADRRAIAECLRTMCEGMKRYETQERNGLEDLADLDRYCHCVAGVVGEMLTELFCNFRTDLDPQREALRRLSARFGRGLQMTNILKDVWDDLAEGRCWLPRAEFTQAGYDLERLSAGEDRERFNAVAADLVGLTHHHLREALRYTLRLPPEESGIRQFCLWSIGLAVLTLQRIQATPDYASSAAVKVPRAELYSMVSAARAAAHDDAEVERLFESWSLGLPLLAPTWNAPEPDAAERDGSYGWT